MEQHNGDSPKSFRILCSNYPPQFTLDKSIAKDYFRLFGNLKKIIFKPKSRICIVEYLKEESMLNALHHGGEFNGKRFDIRVERTSPAKKKRDVKTIHKSTPNALWVDKNDVQSELDAMSGVSPRVHQLSNIVDLTDTRSQSPKQKRTPKLRRDKPTERLNKSKKNDTPKDRKEVKTRIATKSSENFYPEQTELVNLVLSQANNVEEKYRILDARDKLIRAKLKKQHQVKSAATIGTCPDMCPEKERLMRETQHQVALYEQEDNARTMNQRKAVKQYSRSSADQESPLAHELRPVSVLQMTMGYLMHTIVDLCDTDDVNLAEWYHFLWDRTRGIRKDITQQELCSIGAVELVEQCARFHIHCSARLVAEDPSVFDQKINTENLTKCLQTLKYMYHDLRLKGESCANEAEFRSYIILLNLNDGNFMWEVQQLHREIQISEPVKFAIEVYSCLDKNNYVKFFKLLRSTTYLNACLLMRYFVQVRVTAIKILLKCYSPRALKTVYPLDELVDILAFDDKESAIEFFQTYNISVNDEKTHIVIEKGSFITPESPYLLDRSINVVESKRVHSVGRVICGKDLPPKIYEHHIPQNSFDINGMLIGEDFLEECDLEQAKSKLLANLADEPAPISNIDQQQQQSMSPVPLLEESDSNNSSSHAYAETINKPATMSDNITNTDQIDSAMEFKQDSIFGIERLPQQTTESSSDIWSRTDNSSFINTVPFTFQSKNIFQQSNTANQSLFGVMDKPREEMTTTPSKFGGFKFDLPFTKPTNANNLPIKEKEVSLPTFSFGAVTERTSVDEDLERSEELRLQEEEKKKEAIEQQKQEERKRKQKLFKDEQLRIRLMLMEEARLREIEIENDVADVLSELVSKVEQNIRDEKLNAIKQCIRDRNVRRIFQKWHHIVCRNKRKRKALDCQPMWINCTSLKQAAAEMHMPAQDLTLSLAKRYKNGQALDIETCLLSDGIKKINLLTLTYETLSKRMFSLYERLQKNIYWKVDVKLPQKNRRGFSSSLMENVLMEAFDWKKMNDGVETVLEQYQISSFEMVTFCIEQSNVQRQRSDANGMIFIAENFDDHLLHRISNYLQGFGRLARVPVVIILNNNTTNVKPPLLQDERISDYIIMEENFSQSHQLLVNVIEDALVYLASRVEKQPPLELDTLHSFVEKNLCTEIWRKANSFAKWNCHYKSCLKDPNFVIRLYNDGLHKLSQIVSDERCKEYAEFPDVFRDFLPSEIPDCLPCCYYYFPSFWKTERYSRRIRQIFNSLKMPKFDEPWPPKDELQLEVAISKYCKKIFIEPLKPFYRLMSVLLLNVDPNVNFEDIENVLWTSVVEGLAVEKLKETDLNLHNTEFRNQSIFNQFIVVYEVEKLKSYITDDWFYLTHPMVKKHVAKCLKSEKKSSQHEEKTTTTTFDDIDMDETIDKVTKQLKRKLNQTNVLKELESFNSLMKDLETSIKITKTISCRFEEELEKAIKEN